MPNSSFADDQNLQIAWDSTSLGALKTCPRFYQLSIVEGYEPKRTSVHLLFGLWTHAARERYDHAKAQGLSHEAALYLAIRYALEVTWDKELKRGWISDDKYKNRTTLIRTLVWFLDQFRDDPFQTVILANGKPAVELSFRFETDYTSTDGQKYMLCGHLDRMATLNGETHILDIKTSKSIIEQDFFDKFTPHNQFSLYTLASRIVYALPVKGIIVDGAQVAVTFSRFGRGFIPRSEAQLEEWYKDLGYWLKTAEAYAKAQYWPMNEMACDMYGGCRFRGICSKGPSVREAWLPLEYRKRVWDPLQTRGDI